MLRTPRPTPLVQGIFYLATGLWPILHLRSFEAVTGPKVDKWLVRTIGGLIGAVGTAMRERRAACCCMCRRRVSGGRPTSQSVNVNATGNWSTLFAAAGLFAAAIQAELTRIGSALTPANIVSRAQAPSCADATS